MPIFERDGVEIYWEEDGNGHPLLIFAPGGMRSSVDYWLKSPFDPRQELRDRYRVIAIDQRNAGRSSAPVTAGDGWHSYTADHLALLDHLEIELCHLFGGCIGSSFCLGLLDAAPQRVTAAVLQKPIGLEDNRAAFFEMFDSWAQELQHSPAPDGAVLEAFRQKMYGGDFVFNVSRDSVSACSVPLLVLAGNDLYHPTSIAREIAELAPNAELVLDWMEPAVVPQTVERVRSFLRAHDPTQSGLRP